MISACRETNSSTCPIARPLLSASHKPVTLLFEFLRGLTQIRCELRDHGAYSFETQILCDEELVHRPERPMLWLDPSRTPREMAIVVGDGRAEGDRERLGTLTLEERVATVLHGHSPEASRLNNSAKPAGSIYVSRSSHVPEIGIPSFSLKHASSSGYRFACSDGILHCLSPICRTHVPPWGSFRF